jgi:acyl-CoA thioester hydrolase
LPEAERPMADLHQDSPLLRSAYKAFFDLPTRWIDNDIYGHVNNVNYYSFFDTAIAHYLIREGGLDPKNSRFVGFCIESGCRYRKPITYPEMITAGIRVGRLGRSSVRYEIGLFRGDDDETAADGYFVHVFVDRDTEIPSPLPPSIRDALSKIVVETD